MCKMELVTVRTFLLVRTTSYMKIISNFDIFLQNKIRTRVHVQRETEELKNFASWIFLKCCIGITKKHEKKI